MRRAAPSRRNFPSLFVYGGGNPRDRMASASASVNTDSSRHLAPHSARSAPRPLSARTGATAPPQLPPRWRSAIEDALHHEDKRPADAVVERKSRVGLCPRPVDRPAGDCDDLADPIGGAGEHQCTFLGVP